MSRRRTLNAAARREAARAEAARLQRQHRRNRGLIIGAVVLVVALVVTAGFIIWRGSQQTYLDDVERSPQGSDLTGGIPVSADGVAGIENPTAPRLDVYVDVQSPESVAFWQAQSTDMQALSADGSVSLWVHLVGFVDGGVNGASTRAGQAAVVVADRAPELFLPFLKAEFAQRANGAEHLTDPGLVSLALEVGVSQDVADRFDDNLFNAWFVAATEQAQRDGIETLPTVELDGSPLSADWSADGALAAAVAAALGG